MVIVFCSAHRVCTVCAAIHEVTGLIYFIILFIDCFIANSNTHFCSLAVLQQSMRLGLRLGLGLKFRDLGSLAWFEVKNEEKKRATQRKRDSERKKIICWTINQFIVIVNLSKNWTCLQTIGILLFSIFFLSSTFLYAFQ